MRADDHDRPLGPDPGASPRPRARSAARGFDRLVRSGRSRRVSPRRLAVGGLIVAAVAWGGYEGGRIGLRRLADWVAAQPEHQLAFAAIALEPPPPPFVRRGAEGILAEVRRRGGYPEAISTLGLDADRLRADLGRSPWVEAVGAIRRSHGGLAVAVTYRRPMALMVYPTADPLRDLCVLVDRRGVELPTDDNEIVWQDRKPYTPQGGRPLVQIRNFGECEPGRIGRPWVARDRRIGAGLVAQAIDLARFLQDHRPPPGPPGLPGSALGFPRIELDRQTLRLALLDPGRNRVDWGAGPGAEGPDEPKAAEKWALLVRYVAAHGSLGLGPDEVLVLEYPEARKVSTRPRSRRGPDPETRIR